MLANCGRFSADWDGFDLRSSVIHNEFQRESREEAGEAAGALSKALDSAKPATVEAMEATAPVTCYVSVVEQHE